MRKMSWRHGRFMLPLAAATCLLNAAFAAMLSGSAPPPPSTANPNAGQPVAAMSTGRVSAINIQQKTLAVDGRSLALHPTDLRVYTGTSIGSISQLQVGSRIRYALETGGSHRVVLIMLDGQP